MPRVRVFKIGAGSNPKVRVYKVQATGASPQPKLRLFGVSAFGPGLVTAAVLDPIPDRTIEPMTTSSLTASPATGSSTPDDYIWRIVSGGPMTLNLQTNHNTVVFTTPAPLPPSSGAIVVGV